MVASRVTQRSRTGQAFLCRNLYGLLELLEAGNLRIYLTQLVGDMDLKKPLRFCQDIFLGSRAIRTTKPFIDQGRVETH
jgi:hypothetical protein